VRLIKLFDSFNCLFYWINIFYLTNIESEDDKLNEMGMYKDKDGNIYPIEEAIE
jgi:hypothetical protein